MATADRLVWIDCEMTGLELSADALVEIACIVTDGDLNELDEGIDIVIKPPAESLEHMGDLVRNMHTESGLLPELAGGVTLTEAEDAVIEYIASHCDDPKKAPLCGSSIYVDRGFLARDMQRLDSSLHYRLIDVSSFKEVARRWYPRTYYAAPEKNGGHRALADIRESIAELRYYRDTILVEAPGLDGAAAKKIAQQHVIGPKPDTTESSA